MRSSRSKLPRNRNPSGRQTTNLCKCALTKVDIPFATRRTAVANNKERQLAMIPIPKCLLSYSRIDDGRCNGSGLGLHLDLFTAVVAGLHQRGAQRHDHIRVLALHATRTKAHLEERAVALMRASQCVHDRKRLHGAAYHHQNRQEIAQQHLGHLFFLLLRRGRWGVWKHTLRKEWKEKENKMETFSLCQRYIYILKG